MIKTLTRLMVVALMICVLSSGMFAKVQRRIVMEDHTGAWCGWCVLGNQAMEDMLSLYGDKFIPVAFHNGDKMAVGNISTLQSTVGNAMGLTGYPSGLLNRMQVVANGQNTLFHHPIYWNQTVAAHINDQSDVNISVTKWNLDKTAKKLTLTLSAKMEADYSGQLAFNLYILEDGQTGSGTGWDQTNYLAGRSGYETHPYYKLTNPVKNYSHMNVLIDALGGAWGDASAFTSTTLKAGDVITKDYDVDLSTYPIQNYDNLWFAGLVQQVGTGKEILNAVSVNKQMPKPKVAFTTSKDMYYLSSNRNSTKSQDFSFKNESAYDAEVTFSADASASLMPTGWTATFTPEKATVKAGQSVTVKVDVKTDNTVFYGVFAFNAKVSNGTEFDGSSSSASMGILTDGVDNIFYAVDETGIIPIMISLYNHPTYAANSAVIPMNAETYAAYPRDKFKIAMFPETFSSRGTLVASGNNDFLSIANEFIDAGKPIYISSIDDLFFIAGNYASLMPDAATMDLFKNKLFINGYKLSSPYASSTTQGYPTVVNVVGVLNDDVTDGLDFNANEYDQTAHPYYTLFMDQVQPLDAKKVTTVLKYDNTTMTKGQENAAVKILTGKGKAFYQGFSLDCIKYEVTRTTLLGNIMTWLLATAGVDDNPTNLNSSNITVSPNPAVSDFKVKFENAKSANGMIYLANVKGENLLTISNNINSGSNEFNVTTAGLPSGTYFIITLINGYMSQQPIVITK